MKIMTLMSAMAARAKPPRFVPLSRRERGKAADRTSRMIGLAFVVMSVAFVAGCSGKPPQQQSSTTPHNVTLTKAQQNSIHVVTVATTQYHTTITTTGVVDFDHDHATDILAPFSGAVTKVLVA